MYSVPGKVKLRTFLRFTKQGPKTAQDEHAACHTLDNISIERHYFKLYMEPDQDIRYVYRPVRQVKQ